MLIPIARTTSMLIMLTPALASEAPAHEIPPPAGDVEVRLVCASGCDEVRHRGQRYVVGEYGERYGVSMTNRSDRWVEAVLGVDGRDVVDGRRISPRSRGYLLAPWQEVTIEGWRRNADEVAAFRFTSVGDSYAGRIGEARNAGEVRVDVYPERAPIHVVPPPRPRPVPEPWNEDGARAPKSEAPGTPETTADARQRLRRDDGNNLGTDYGETRWAPVEERDFQRADPDHPSRTVTIRYDDYAGLVARGVLPRERWSYDGPRWVPPPPPRRDDW